MRMGQVVAAVLAAPVLMAAGAPSALAHHGFGTFVMDEDIELTGTVTDLAFVNPHSWLYLDVVQDDGEVVAFRCEMRSANTLRRSGWTPDLFPVGEEVTITGSPDRDDPYSCYVSTVIFDDGSSLDRYGQILPPAPAEEGERPLRLANGEPNISGRLGDRAARDDGPARSTRHARAVESGRRIRRRRSSRRSTRDSRCARHPGSTGTCRRHRGRTRTLQFPHTGLADRSRPRCARGSGRRGSLCALVRDDEHRCGLVRRTDQPGHPARGHDTDAVRPSRARTHDLHDHGRAPGRHRTEPHRSLDRPLGRRCARRRHGRIRGGTLPAAHASQRAASRRRTVPLRPGND